MSGQVEDLDNPFWRFSLSLYGRPGVSDAFIALQDRHGLDVDLALFALWLGAGPGVGLDAGRLALACRAVASWHEEVVRPLRGVRRALKTGCAGFPAAGALRGEVKRLELRAEEIEHAALAALAADWPTGPASTGLAMANLDALLIRIGAEADPQALDAIRRALTKPAANAPGP